MRPRPNDNSRIRIRTHRALRPADNAPQRPTTTALARCQPVAATSVRQKRHDKTHARTRRSTRAPRTRDEPRDVVNREWCVEKLNIPDPGRYRKSTKTYLKSRERDRKSLALFDKKNRNEVERGRERKLKIK